MSERVGLLNHNSSHLKIIYFPLLRTYYSPPLPNNFNHKPTVYSPSLRLPNATLVRRRGSFDVGDYSFPAPAVNAKPAAKLTQADRLRRI